jgi:hypothetical protein
MKPGAVQVTAPTTDRRQPFIPPQEVEQLLRVGETVKGVKQLPGREPSTIR